MTKPGNKSEKIDRIAGLLAIFIIAISAFIGFQKKIDGREHILLEQFPGITIIEGYSNDLFEIKHPDLDSTSFIAIGEGEGYGGKLTMAVVIDYRNKVSEVKCIDNIETPSFMARVQKRNFTRSFKKIDTQSTEEEKLWPDAITGATLTTNAMTMAVKSATGVYRTEKLGLLNWRVEKHRINWGWRYTVLLLIFVVAWLINKKWFPLRKQSRWLLLIFNMAFLGFWLGNQLSISQVIRLLNGDFPSINTYLFFYLLLGGTIFFILILNKNLYCDRICPFGSAQQCINAIGAAKRHPTNGKKYLVWFQRILVLTLISASLIIHNPTIYNYEVFSAFFKIIGTVFQFSLLIIVLLSSLFLIRPWCNILCPIKPITDYIRMIRNWLIR